MFTPKSKLYELHSYESYVDDPSLGASPAPADDPPPQAETPPESE